MKNSIISFFRLAFGNIIEWYDFSLYIYLSSYIAADFFPQHDPFLSLLFVLITFAIGSLVRPLGGIIMGFITNRYGLHYAINLCVLSMGVSTCAITILPSYHTWGIISPLLLTLIRIVQGLSVGGQFPGLLSLSIKQNKDFKGLTSSLMFSISSLGFLLASMTTYVMKWAHFSPSITWRIPFAMSGILFAIYIYLNRNEHHGVEAPPQPDEGLISAFKQQYKQIFAVITLTFMGGSLYYLVFTYFVKYQILYLHMPRATAFLINSLILFLACALYPLFGIWTDISIKRKRLFHISNFTLLILSIPLFYIMRTHTFSFILFSFIVFSVLITAIQSAMTPWFSEVFDKEWRTACCGLAYNIGLGLGGTFPAIALIISDKAPHYGLALLIMAVSLLGAIGAYVITSLRQQQKAELRAKTP